MKPVLLTLLTALIIGSPAWACGETNPAAERQISGGWASVSTDNERVIAAAEYAVSAQAAATGEDLKLSAVQEARQQVVAGMNYKLTLCVVRNGKKAFAAAVVWAKLDRTYKLTQWSWK